ncbi:hypothetical protein OG21DRAFT_1526526 [Imleria badia]|nr:hypothetical protein OG21DRAFT_1526526 [Imleria badia]
MTHQASINVAIKAWIWCNRSKISILSCSTGLDYRSLSSTCISQIVVNVIPGTCQAVILESLEVVDPVEIVGDKGGGVGEEDDEVRESVGPGDGSEDEIIEGVKPDEGDDGSDGQAGEGKISKTLKNSLSELKETGQVVV